MIKELKAKSTFSPLNRKITYKSSNEPLWNSNGGRPYSSISPYDVSAMSTIYGTTKLGSLEKDHMKTDSLNQTPKNSPVVRNFTLPEEKPNETFQSKDYLNTNYFVLNSIFHENKFSKNKKPISTPNYSNFNKDNFLENHCTLILI